MPIRQDLSAFLTKLLEYREHYSRVKLQRAAILNDLFTREDDGYCWYRAYLQSQTAERVTKETLKGIGYHELSEMLDEQIRQVSDVGKSDPESCHVGHIGPKIMFPSEKLEYDLTWIYPAKYMMSFWRRRDMEGTIALAGHVIGRVLEGLRAP